MHDPCCWRRSATELYRYPAGFRPPGGHRRAVRLAPVAAPRAASWHRYQMQGAKVLIARFGNAARRQALHQAPGLADPATQLKSQILGRLLAAQGQMKRQRFTIAL